MSTAHLVSNRMSCLHVTLQYSARSAVYAQNVLVLQSMYVKHKYGTESSIKQTFPAFSPGARCIAATASPLTYPRPSYGVGSHVD